MVASATPIRRSWRRWSSATSATGKSPACARPSPISAIPQRRAGADPANPVGETRVLVEPGQPRALTYAVLRPWRPGHRQHRIQPRADDRRARRRRSSTAGSRRARARAAATFTPRVEQDKTSRSADATFVAFTPLTDDWQAALKDVRAVIADALAKPPSQAEIDREFAEFDVVFANLVEQRRIQRGLAARRRPRRRGRHPRGGRRARRRSSTCSARMRPRFTPDGDARAYQGAVHRRGHPRAVPHARGGRGRRRGAAHGPARPGRRSGSPRAPSAEPIAFADLPPIGTPSGSGVREPLAPAFLQSDVEQLDLRQRRARRCSGRPTNEPGRAHGAGPLRQRAAGLRRRRGGLCRARPDGAGRLRARPARPGRARPASPPGASSASTSRSRTARSSSRRMTRAEDVADQLYLFAAKLAHAALGRRAVRARQGERAARLRQLWRQPEGRAQSRSRVAAARPRPALRHARLRPSLRADHARRLPATSGRGCSRKGRSKSRCSAISTARRTVAALSRTFGALPPRAAGAGRAARRDRAVPGRQRRAGRADPSRRARPGSGGHRLADRRRLGRRCRKAASSRCSPQLFSNRLMDAMRERAGRQLFAARRARAGRSTRPAAATSWRWRSCRPSRCRRSSRPPSEIAADLAADRPDAPTSWRG